MKFSKPTLPIQDQMQDKNIVHRYLPPSRKETGNIITLGFGESVLLGGNDIIGNDRDGSNPRTDT